MFFTPSLWLTIQVYPKQKELSLLKTKALLTYQQIYIAIAKVTRDRMMVRLSKKFPAYGFKAHKGYGTKFHKAAISARGRSKIHRHTFLCSPFSGQ